MIFLNKRIHLITGKGGVGRTSVSVALAHAAAKCGKRVLITEVGDPEGGYSAVGQHFGKDELSEEARPMTRGIDACRLWGTTGHELFGRSLLPAGPLIHAALRSRALQGFMMATPGVYELGIFYHLLELLEDRLPDGRLRHDFVVVDMPATGHALALTKLPATVLGLMPRGPIAKAMRRGQDLLYSNKTTSAWVVTLPERFVVSESLELLGGLRQSDVPIGGAIMNCVQEDPFTSGERAALQGYLNEQPLMGQTIFKRIEAAQEELERLESLAEGLVVRLPWLHGLEAVELCRALASEFLREPRAQS